MVLGAKIGVNIHRDYHYLIHIGYDILGNQDLSRFNASRIAVVTEPNVMRLQGAKLETILKNQKPIFIMLPAGEKAKTNYQIERINSVLSKEGFDRDSMLIAFGGGCVGDPTGDAASRYLRGIKIIHIGTTYVAMMDSSIGGKVAVNTKYGKNRDGAFYQPVAVFSDISFLDTLPPEQVRNGLAEIVKEGIANDSHLFYLLEENPNPLDWSKEMKIRIIEMCSEIKRNIVEVDELERTGLREALNYAHTFAHAIEKHSGHKVTHGRAVGIGMDYEARVAVKLGLLSKKTYKRISKLLKRTGFSETYDGDAEELIADMIFEKKNRNGEIRMTVPDDIGSVAHERRQYSVPVDVDTIRAVLKER